MGTYNVHGGHNSIVPGANKYLNEVTEDRAVKNKVISYLKAAGHTVYDCTDDVGTTQNANLANIVKKCNAHSVDLDISIHLNAGGGTGTEVWYYEGDSAGKAKAAAVSAAVAKALELKDRGAKATKSLYVLNSTKATAILVECCFVDSQPDATAWDADKCAKAIVEAVTGKTVSSGSSGSSSGSSSSASSSSSTSGSSASSTAKKDLGSVDVYYAAYAGGKWWPEVKNNTDWAGQGNDVPIKYLGFRVTKGTLTARAYTKNNPKGLDPITFGNSYDEKDLVNGVIGDGSDITAVELYYNTPSGYNYKYARYKVSVSGNSAYYPEQIDTQTGSGMDGYAGDKKNAVDKLQAWIA